jgi:hypothetical protein
MGHPPRRTGSQRGCATLKSKDSSTGHSADRSVPRKCNVVRVRCELQVTTSVFRCKSTRVIYETEERNHFMAALQEIAQRLEQLLAERLEGIRRRPQACRLVPRFPRNEILEANAVSGGESAPLLARLRWLPGDSELPGRRGRTEGHAESSLLGTDHSPSGPRRLPRPERAIAARRLRPADSRPQGSRHDSLCQREPGPRP